MTVMGQIQSVMVEIQNRFDAVRSDLLNFLVRSELGNGQDTISDIRQVSESILMIHITNKGE